MTRPALSAVARWRRMALTEHLDDVMRADGWTRQQRYRARRGIVGLDALVHLAVEHGYRVTMGPEGVEVHTGPERGEGER